MQSKLEKLWGNILPGPSMKTANNSLPSGMFPDAAEIAALSPIDRCTENKNTICNFRFVSILNELKNLRKEETSR